MDIELKIEYAIGTRGKIVAGIRGPPKNPISGIHGPERDIFDLTYLVDFGLRQFSV